jgi:uncharacterized protein (DUF2249 family)
MITKDWKVSRVLEQYPGCVDVFIDASPHFSKLKNPMLRKVLAPRVTVQQAAAIGGVALDTLLRNLNAAIGELYEAASAHNDKSVEAEEAEGERVNTAVIETTAPGGEVVLDVRPIISSGSDPLKVILKTVKELKEGEALHLVNSFEPIPLYSVLGQRGFEHFTRRGNGDWHVYFYRKQAVTGSSQITDSGLPITGKTFSTANIPQGDQEDRIVELDVRGLAPPEPMMRILETLTELDEKAVLLVHHHREPMMLYEKLEQRGYSAVTERIREDYFKVLIQKKQS